MLSQKHVFVDPVAIHRSNQRDWDGMWNQRRIENACANAIHIVGDIVCHIDWHTFTQLICLSLSDLVIALCFAFLIALYPPASVQEISSWIGECQRKNEDTGIVN